MQLAEACEFFNLAPGASKSEIERARQRKTLAFLPDRVRRGEDAEAIEMKVEQAIEDIKRVNEAKDTLLEVALSHPLAEHHEQDLTKAGQTQDIENTGGYRCHEAPTSTRKPCSNERPRRNMKPGVSEHSGSHDNSFPSEDGTPDCSANAVHFSPAENDYRKIIQDLADVHRGICRLSNTVEALHHSQSLKTTWNHLWLTIHMAGATTEDVWDICRYTWLKLLQSEGRLRRSEWEKLQVFISAASSAVTGCDRVLASWGARGEHDSCLELYRSLREYPIAMRKKSDPAWQAQDSQMIAMGGAGMGRSGGRV
ncbi:hypothetical protein F4780DRAFT_747620 [Xylariomycetidae sp. FL0641]|nr:hypothetical protein F4780DRAFT_747620 [Xylariomycetidae sp. FL0641]